MNRLLFLISCLVCLAFSAFAQDPDLPITLDNPNQAMLVHLNYLQQGSYDPERSARALAGIPDSIDGGELAVMLKQILDSEVYVLFGTIPTDPNYIDSTTNTSIFIPYPRELPRVYLEKIGNRWFYSAETVEAIPELHREHFPLGSDFLVRLVPRVGQKKFLGLFIWQYLGLGLILLVGLIIYFFFNLLLRPLIKRLSKFKLYPQLVPVGMIDQLTRYVSVLLVLRFFKIALPSLFLPPRTTEITDKVIWLFSTVLVMLTLLKVLDILVLYIRQLTAKTESRMDDQLVPVLKTMAQVLIVAGIVIQVFQMFDIDVTAIIAGLSIGGLALALAAKDTAQNLFGSVTLFLDRPFQVGDWVNFDGIDGSVEEIGIRATRIRTFENSLVYVPNGQLANKNINNYGLRQFRRFKTNISITYDTPPALIQLYVEGLKAIVAGHPKTRKDSFEIHLNQFSGSSLDILFYIFFEVPSWSEELVAKQEIMLAAIELAAELGVRFAYPSQSIYLEQMPGQESLVPNYREELKEKDQRLDTFLKRYQEKVSGNGK